MPSNSKATLSWNAIPGGGRSILRKGSVNSLLLVKPLASRRRGT